MNKIKAECDSCAGTGVYCGFAEPKGVGVVCLRCNGSGAVTILYRPFTGRKLKQGVKTVRLSRDSFIATGVGPTGSEISYEEFKAGKMPYA